MPIAPDDPRLQKCGFAKLKGLGEDLDFYFKKYEIVLGRRSKSTVLDVMLGDNMNISRQHALIRYNFDTKVWELTVQGKNGVTVNGNLFTPQSQPAALHSQDLLQIGDRSFYFLLPRAPRKKAKRKPSAQPPSTAAAAAGGGAGPSLPQAPSAPSQSTPSYLPTHQQQQRYTAEGYTPPPGDALTPGEHSGAEPSQDYSEGGGGVDPGYHQGGDNGYARAAYQQQQQQQRQQHAGAHPGQQGYQQQQGFEPNEDEEGDGGEGYDDGDPDEEDYQGQGYDDHEGYHGGGGGQMVPGQLGGYAHSNGGLHR